MCRTLASFAFLLAGLVGACSSSSGNADGSVDPTKDPAPVHDPKKDPPVDPTKDPATQIVLGLDSEAYSSLGVTIGAVEIITTIDGVVAHEILDASKGPIFPHELRLYAPKTKLDAAVQIEVIAREKLDSPQPPWVTRLARTQFVKGATKLAYVTLEVRCNHVQLLGGGGPYGPTCDAPTTCVAGACSSSDLPPLPDYYADWAKNPPSACGTGAPELTIGQGERTLQPLADGATVRLEEGPQCGHHMWLSLRMKNLAQAGTITTLSATQPGTGITVPATAYPYAWGPSGGGACDLVGLRFQLDVSDAKAADFLGQPLDLKVEAKDKAGHTVTSMRHVMIDTTMTLTPGRNCPGGPGPGGGDPGGGG
jgi:hypothetical protein